MKLAGKTILVTGGTDGIGGHLIRQLRDKGALVVATGRNPERIAATRAAGFEVLAADLSTTAGPEQLFAAWNGRPLDILVNNAGAGTDHDFRVSPPIPEETDATINLNLHAPINLITRLMPLLRAQPAAMIVNVTSGLAIAPNAGSPAYCATKAGLRSYTQALRAQLTDTNIHVLEALPPLVDTAMTAGRGSKKLPPEECARQIIRAMERGVNEANVGMVKVLRIVESISPALARRIMIKF
jgi:uncharacterized oxidoreductase